MKIIKFNGEEELFKRSKLDAADVTNIVQDIIKNVMKNGDRSLSQYTEKFDRVKIDSFRVKNEDIERSISKMDEDVLKALKKAAKNIEKFHRAQIPDDWSMEIDGGIKAGQIIRPLETVGCYIPGGRAIYPSTILMSAIPAKIAGVSRVICCTPPQPDGTVSNIILAAAKISGIDEIYMVGGAQAVAAMAYGTESIPKVDKIVGPGNIFVATAKKLLYGEVDIDFPAGPSEVLIIADETARPDYVALDLMAQAEHDPNAASVLVTTSMELAESVNREIDEKLPEMKRKEIIAESLDKYGEIILVDSLGDAVKFSNKYAPEHLIIATEDPEMVLKNIKNAGSIFLGNLTPVAAGDYGSGTNHILPTSGCASMYSGLSAESFIKKPTVQRLSKEGISNLKDVVVPLAEYEGLYAHAESFKKRVKDKDSE